MLECKVADFSRYVPVFTHKSAMRLTNGQSYERYEFIGDAVINFVVAKLLFDMYPDADEGVLTRLRTRLVSGKCLARLAQHLGLHRAAVRPLFQKIKATRVREFEEEMLRRLQHRGGT